MSTLIPSNAGPSRAWVESAPSPPLPNASRMPRSAMEFSGGESLLDPRGYSNVNIDIPLDTQSTLSMELTHDGKVMELVARFESFTLRTDSDESQAQHTFRHRTTSSSTIRPSESSSDTVLASPASVGGSTEVVSPESVRLTHSPRKPIPSPWKITQPRAPVFQTDIRKEERERRKSIQGASTPKPLRAARSTVDLRKSRIEGATYLTKDAIEAVDSNIASGSGSSSPKRPQRQHSKASLQSPTGSPSQSGTASARERPRITINISPNRSARLNVQDQERAPSIISNQGSEYYSAHSPVSLAPSRVLSRRSSRESFHTAKEDDQEPPHLSLTGADGVEQTTNDRGKTVSRPVSHSRSKTESHLRLAPAPGQKKMIRPAIPLSLKIASVGGPSTKRGPHVNIASPSSSGSGSPASPTKSSSRIPRMTSGYDASTKASSLKRSQSSKTLSEIKRSGNMQTSIPDKKKYVLPQDIPLPKTPAVASCQRHVRTLNSSGNTPIIDTFQGVSMQKEEQPDKSAIVTSYLNDVDPNARPDHTPFTEEKEIEGDHSSRNTSTSTMKVILPDTTNREDFVTVRDGKKAVLDDTSLSNDDTGLQGRAEQQISPAGAPSLRSKPSSELRATAPEFVPQPQDELQPSAQNAMTLPWMTPNFTFDPWALDSYGIPWWFHMYPVDVKRIFRSPKKNKTFPRGRGRATQSQSPKKFDRSTWANEEQPQEQHDEKPQEPVKDVMTPFASQLDEIARNAASRRENDTQNGPVRRGYMTMPPRSGRPLRNIGNGLYDTFGRRGNFRPAGLPIEASAPFPDPIPPSGRKEYVGYTFERPREGCGNVDIERAAEWGGKACHACDPDH